MSVGRSAHSPPIYPRTETKLPSRPIRNEATASHTPAAHRRYGSRTLPPPWCVPLRRRNSTTRCCGALGTDAFFPKGTSSDFLTTFSLFRCRRHQRRPSRSISSSASGGSFSSSVLGLRLTSLFSSAISGGFSSPSSASLSSTRLSRSGRCLKSFLPS